MEASFASAFSDALLNADPSTLRVSLHTTEPDGLSMASGYTVRAVDTEDFMRDVQSMATAAWLDIWER